MAAGASAASSPRRKPRASSASRSRRSRSRDPSRKSRRRSSDRQREVQPSSYDEVYRSFRWQVPPDFNIAHYACARWAQDAGRIALHWEDESGEIASFTYAQLQASANRLSNVLRGLGIARGDRVALILPQRVETVVTYLACFQLGAIAVPLSFL